MFIIITINIVFMMITNSVFSALSPYLWLGDVFSKNELMIQFYSAAQTLFYMTNTFFACLVLWVIHHFGINSQRNGLATIVSNTREDAISSKDDLTSLMNQSHYSGQRFGRKSPYLVMDSKEDNES